MGDTVKAEVYAKYLDTNSNNWTQALADFMAAIAGGTAPVGTVVDGGLPGSTGGTTPFFTGYLNKDSEEGPAPKAYLNYLIFDRDYHPIDGGFVRMTEAAREYGQQGAHEKMAAEIPIREAGYVYIYLSNDNVALGGAETEVYFDDFKVEHLKSPVVQSNDYYPFGLTFNNYQRENSVDQRYLYNGKEIQRELDLNWLDYGARMYDPTIGRFAKLDRFLEKYMPISPYGYVASNPILNVDVNGDYIIIYGQDDEGHRYSVLYENGKAYHYSKDKEGNIVKGDEYDGKNDFIENTVADLNKIGSTEEGGKVVNRLVSSKDEYGVHEVSGLGSSRFIPNKNSGGLTSGGNIYYSRHRGFLDGVQFKSTYTLGHELYHAYQRDLGSRGYWALATIKGKDGIVPLAETQAVGFENYLRASFNENGYNQVREAYSSKFLNITTPVKLKEYRYQRGWPQYGAGWTTPWDITDFINKKEGWINLRQVALKKYSSK